MVIKNKILDRKIDIAKRLILDAYIGAEQRKVIDVIFAQTGVGKTFNIAWSLLKNDIDKGYKKFLFVTPFVDSREQDIEEFDNANYKLKLNIKVTKDINEFLNWDSNTPILLVATLAGATLGDIIDTNGEKIKNICLVKSLLFIGTSHTTVRQVQKKQQYSIMVHFNQNTKQLILDLCGI